MFYNFPQDFTVIEPEKGFLVHMVAGRNVSLSYVTMKPHSLASLHSHPQEQMGMILEGEFKMTIGEESKLLRQGDMYQVPPNVTHGGETRDQSAVILDVFSPPREPYR